MKGQRGFTLIELLVVIAILGVIAAVVALNVTGFFERGTLQSAKTELHQAQTAIVSAMADCESGVVNASSNWSGQPGIIVAPCWNGTPNTPGDAAYYAFGPFKARYMVNNHGEIISGVCNYTDGWGSSIVWDDSFMNWKLVD